ncbi:hypothetical protein F1B92_08535 [Campylobacter sp. FMV-PI01]|uniref:Uncharacterized protein n=1 Tax=Campylobacter portucalensis TaxID=2608384 RepID=A0A6L5WN47_9BACT|nr:hypothetical protein [Campylobacter portucalensis]MSN97203.1 hypothetical protein [Campylobacter portucalensis]
MKQIFKIMLFLSLILSFGFGDKIKDNNTTLQEQNLTKQVDKNFKMNFINKILYVSFIFTFSSMSVILLDLNFDFRRDSVSKQLKFELAKQSYRNLSNSKLQTPFGKLVSWILFVFNSAIYILMYLGIIGLILGILVKITY